MPFAATWMDPEIVILSEVRYRKRNIILYPLYEKSKTKWYKWTNLKNKTHRLRLWSYSYPREGIIRELGINMYTLLYLKWIANQGLLYSTGDSVHVMWPPGWEGSLGEKGYVKLYGWVALLSTWNYHIVNWLYPNIKKKKKEVLKAFWKTHVVCVHFQTKQKLKTSQTFQAYINRFSLWMLYSWQFSQNR